MTRPAHEEAADARGDDALRAELARLVSATRRLVAAEREAGVVTLPGDAALARETEELARAARRGPAPRAAGSRDVAPARSAPAPARRPAQREGATPRVAAPAPGPAAGPARSGPRPPAAERPRPATPDFVPRVRPLDLPEDWAAAFGDLPARVDACRRCPLGEQRTCIVFGEGAVPAELVFCGEAPGYEEDRSGRPFVGAAGELLGAMIERGMKMRREDVFVLNTLKCRPPRNRAPLPIEVSACRPFLEEQLAVLRPKVIVALGNHAVRALLGESPGITKMHGRVIDAMGAKVVPTFHPAYLLRNPAAKRDAWEDLKKVLALLGRSPA